MKISTIANWKQASLHQVSSHDDPSGFLRVKTLSLEGAPKTVYNFRVAGTHTYFVGKLQAWVHNNNCDGIATVRVTGRGDNRHVSIEVTKGNNSILTHQTHSNNKLSTHIEDGVGYPFAEVTSSSRVALPDPLGAQMKQLGSMSKGDFGPYNKHTNSCLSHVCDILQAGGVTSHRPLDTQWAQRNFITRNSIGE